MPFLRFARDKRGYETTSLMYAGRRPGRSRPRLLYWFRTPPGVKVGRGALDDQAIRWIEEQNPDIIFDWRRILDTKAPPQPPPDDARFRRGRRKSPQTPEPADSEVAGVPAPAVEPDSGAGIAEDAADPLLRLKARYTDLLARITERADDAERTAALRLQAEALNPDAWITPEAVAAGVDAFERRIQDLRAALGLPRRRRSRRGGRRRRSGTEGAHVPAEPPTDPSNQNPE